MCDHLQAPPHAIIAVSDKVGVVDLGQELDRLGWQLIATTGTAELLGRHGVDATTMTSYTGMPELHGGRVKAFHPVVFGGILRDDTEPADAEPSAACDAVAALYSRRIALVVSNFYLPNSALADSADDAVLDSIDIGGPAMIAAAAKNHLRAVPLVHHEQYQEFLTHLRNAGGDPDALPQRLRRLYAKRAMATVSSYYAKVADLLV